MQIALLGYIQNDMVAQLEPGLHGEAFKVSHDKARLYHNWNAWWTEVVHGLRMNSCAQHIIMDDGIAQRFEYLLYERPVAMISESEGVMVDSAW